MSKKLFVGNISWGTDDAKLKMAFEEFGPVQEAKVITDRETKRSRGFAFVTMVNAADADKAMLDMDGKSLDGRDIKVNEAEDKRPQTGGYSRQ